jgi:DNA polymerase-3 subunit epsilon
LATLKSVERFGYGIAKSRALMPLAFVDLKREGAIYVSNFAAIDFETANQRRDSACSVGITVVRNGRVAERTSRLIRPPGQLFSFTHIHGITWADVAGEPAFDEVWADVSRHLVGVRFLAAHNAPFDEGVLNACCEAYGIARPTLPFVCTVNLARSVWSIFPTKLPDVCNRLKIPLQHHDAGSDAEACARIVLAAQSGGWTFRR